MAITFLPPIVPSPFGKAFARHPYQMPDLGHDCSNDIQDGRSYDAESAGHTFTAGFQPVSPSLARRLKDAAKNIGSLYQHEKKSPSPKPSQTPGPGQVFNISPRDRSVERFPLLDGPCVPPENGGEGLRNGIGIARSTDQSWRWHPPDSEGACSAAVQLKQVRECGASEDRLGPSPGIQKSIGRNGQNFRRWASTLRLRRGRSQQRAPLEVADESLRADAVLPLPGVSFLSHNHRKRTSNASSRFITTIKTASLSNDSTSLLHQPHRQSRFSDTRLNRSSEPRPSADSQRPASIVSSDDGALKRSVTRRQILQEILDSEESYAADLKALNNLFSTLLVSVPSIAPEIRQSIQQNVTDMLILHERIVDEIHQIALSGMLREWKSFASPPRSRWKRHGKWQRLDAAIHHQSPLKPNPTEACPDLSNACFRGIHSHTADAIEAAEVARVFAKQMSQFFVYEEYCAKYGTMVQDVAQSHKLIPQWSSYEAGMEALAKSTASLDERAADSRKGATSADLLVKPIQRICRYPLLFGDLHRHTPVVDCPASHAEIEGALGKFREIVREVDLAADSPRVRDQMQRRRLLQHRLRLGEDTLRPTQFRMLGQALLCGVLHVAYQTPSRVDGRYMLCIMFRDHLLVASPSAEIGKFDLAALVFLADARISSPEDGRGLQCHTAPFSWKVIFESGGLLFELLFSACSSPEQQQWLAGIKRGRSLLALERPVSAPSAPGLLTTMFLDTKPLGPLGHAGLLARRVSVHRAATIGLGIATCQVIIRNTQKPWDGQEVKYSATRAINRSQSLLTTHRVTVLAPKRIERVRLEQCLADVWTRETLPYPGMTLPRGGNLIRASAGSVVRKLSFASIHTPFAKRSTSLTLVGSRFSHDTSLETKDEIEEDGGGGNEPLRHEITLDDVNESSEPGGGRLPEEVATTRTSRPSFSANEKSGQPFGDKWSSYGSDGRSKQPRRTSSARSALASGVFLEEKEDDTVADTLGASRKRWSNRLSRLKSLSADGFRHLLNSSKP